MSGDRIDLLKKINALEEENKALQSKLDKATSFVEEYAQFSCPYEIDDEDYMINWSKCNSCGALKGQEKECWKEYFMEGQKMKKVFISQPMKGKSNEEIKRDRELIIKDIEDMMEGEPFEVMDTVFDDFDGATPLKFLAKSLMVMADADAVYFADGWREAMGCRIENRCAIAYGLNIIKD